MALFDTTAFRITEQGLSVLWQKQQIISQNIANQDTPDYKCKYLEFTGVLRDKINENGKKKTELSLGYGVSVDYDTNDQADGNNVDQEVQAGELTKAQFQYEALINQMNGNLSRLRSSMKTN